MNGGCLPRDAGVQGEPVLLLADAPVVWCVFVVCVVLCCGAAERVLPRGSRWPSFPLTIGRHGKTQRGFAADRRQAQVPDQPPAPTYLYLALLDLDLGRRRQQGPFALRVVSHYC